MEKLLICENSKVVLTVYKHWNIRFALTNLLLLQHKNIVINFYKFMADPQLHTAVCIFPPTIWHLYTLALPSFPLLSPGLSYSVPVIDRNPECALNSYTISVLLAVRNSVSLESGWVSVFTASWFWEGRERATQCHLAAGRWNRIEHKICTWYDILLVMFLISTPAYVKNT